MKQNEHLMRRIEGVNRKRFFQLLDQHIESAKEYERIATNLYRQARSKFMQMCMAHERKNPPERVIDKSSRRYAKALLRYTKDKKITRHTRMLLEGLSAWKQHIRELVKVVKHVRRLEERIWDAFETYQEAESDADDENCETCLDELREELALIQTRQKWALAGCDEWKGRLIVILGKLSIVSAGTSSAPCVMDLVR